MNTNDEHQLSHQQQRFCDEYLVHFNAFKAAVNAGYSDNTARKGELLHLPKVQYYLQDAMRKTQSRLQITHDMILSELAKIAFSNMGNYYDEYAVLKPMNQLTNDEKAAISQYQIMDAMDDRGQRIGELSKIKLHNKMAALDKIARHLNFYGTVEKVAVAAAVAVIPGGEKSPESGVLSPESASELSVVSGEKEVLSPESEALSLDSFQHEEGHTPAPLFPIAIGRESHEADALEFVENMENILTLSPLLRQGFGGQGPLVQCLNDRMIDGLNEESIFIGEFALAIAADTGPDNYRDAKACVV